MSTRWSRSFVAPLGAAVLLFSLGMTALAATPEQTATQLLDKLQAGNADAAQAMFTAGMAKAVPAPTLQAIWHSLGELRSRGEPHVAAQQDMQIVVQRLQFARSAVDAQVAVNAEGRIAGLIFKPVTTPVAAPVPADASYREIATEVASPKGNLPATLALPNGSGPFRAVVLVHGSGPQDRDETIGGNRPFLDVARGLAAQGIAVLRYDKRTLVRPEDFKGDFSMDDETTDDAVAAVATLASTSGVDPAHVYVMGHSQGGMLAPRIAARSGKVAGVVLWAAPARSLLTLLPEQNRYLFLRDGSISAEEQAALDRLDAQIAAARGTATVAAKDLPLGQPASYWRAFDTIDPVADAKALPVPILLLQGGRDFQVVDTDWQLWQRGLARQRAVGFHHYPALNHLGIPGEGPGSLQEYATPGHVLPQLIDDVAQWIKTLP